jgi:hypothetical protein
VRQTGGAEDQAIDSEMKSILFLYCRPGLRMLLLPACLMASSKRPERLKPYFTPTQTVMTMAPMMSRLGLDDLHPGGALHAADEDVDDHQRADDRDDDALAGAVGDAEQQGDQATGAGHLGQQVEGRHREGVDGGGGAHRALLEPERQHVGHGERPVLRSSSATSSRATSHATRKPIE